MALLERRGALMTARPSRLQLALAVAVVKSKPNGISLTDYILELRRHLATGQRRSDRHRENRHLDSSAFWKEQHAQLEADFAGSQIRIVELEHKIDLLGKQLEVKPYAAGEAVSPSGSKRKRDAAKGSNVAKSSKRAKLGQGFHSAEPLPPNTFAEDFDTLSLAGKAGPAAVQHLYQLHKLLQQSPSDNAVLVYHLCQAALSLASVISAACKQHHALSTLSAAVANPRGAPAATTPQFQRAADLASVFLASARAFTSLFHGLKKVSDNDAERKIYGPVIYAYVRAFSSLLDSITEASLARAQIELAATEAEPSSTRGRKSKAPSKAPKAPKEENIPRAISTFLAALLSSLDASNATHRELFEGFMFVLLERAGNRLYLYTFDRERSATLEHDISPSENLGTSATGTKKQLELRAANVEAPNLLAVLERAMAVAPAHMAIQPAAVPQASKGGKAATKQTAARLAGSTGKSGLSLYARDKLQRTLVNAVFGCDESNDFMDCLRMPARLAPLPAPPKIDEQDMGNWFKEELWRLLGWEILGRETDW